MFCRNCGHELNNQMNFCPGCGMPMKKYKEVVQTKATSKTALPSDEKAEKKVIRIPSRIVLLYAVLITLIILILITASTLIKKNNRDRLEEQLRLGAAYLEEMNFDMALDAYAAAIEIDEREPRSYLGRANAYMSRASLKIEEAAEDDDFDSAVQDLAMAEKDIQKAEELISNEDYEPEEENIVSQDDIEEYRESINQIQEKEEIKRSSNSYIGKIVEEVLGLSYIGNTSYSEALDSSLFEMDLYNGQGYIAASASDLDGDSQDEIFVVSLEGENTLGSGRNALLFHVLENKNDSWTEQARLDSEQSAGHFFLSEISSSLEQDIFLRLEKNKTAVYTEVCGHEGLGMEVVDWFFCKYTYDGISLQASSIGTADPYEFYFSGPYYNFTESYEDAYDDEGLAFRKRFHLAKQKLSEAGLPSPDIDGPFVRRLLETDESSRLVSSFYRSFDYHSSDDLPVQTLVSLVDWTYAERAEENAAEGTAPPEIYQLALYQHTVNIYESDFEKRMDGNGYALYSYYDIDRDGVFELLINTALSWSENNTDHYEPAIYTMRDGAAVRIPLDYAISEGEYCELDVSKEGKTLLYTCKQRDLDRYGLEFYSDYTVYEIMIENGRAKTTYLSKFTGSIEDAEPSRCLIWFDASEKTDFRTVDLIRRFHSGLKTDYRLENYTINGNELSGNLIMPAGDGVFNGGTAVIHMESKTADVNYSDDWNNFYGTDHLDLQ